MTLPNTPPAARAGWPPALQTLAAGWRRIALAGLVAVATGALLWWAADDRRWEAEAVLALGRPGAALTLDERYAEPSIDPAFPYRVGSVRAYPELARMAAVAAETRAALGDAVPAAWTARDVARRVRVRAAADGTLLVVTARAADPETAASLANAFASTFSRLMAGVFDPSASDAAASAIRIARDAAGADLTAAEAAVADYQASHDLSALEVEVAALARRYDGLLGDLDRLEAAERSVAALAAGEAGATRSAALAAVLQLGALGGLAGGDAPRLELPAEALTGGPDAAALAAELAAARASAEAAAAALPSRMSAARGALTRERAALARLERERALAEDRFTALSRRSAELDAERQTAPPELRVAMAANSPLAPTLTGLWRTILAAAILGIAAGAALVLLWPRGRTR